MSFRGFAFGGSAIGTSPLSLSHDNHMKVLDYDGLSHLCTKIGTAMTDLGNLTTQVGENKSASMGSVTFAQINAWPSDISGARAQAFASYRAEEGESECLGESYHNSYAVMSTGSNATSYGHLDLFSDGGGHVLYEVLTTTADLNADGTIDGTGHHHDAPKTYWRAYGLSANPTGATATGAWTQWKQLYADKGETDTRFSQQGNIMETNEDNIWTLQEQVSALQTSIAAKPSVWSGTQAAYDAITTKDANTLYLITE